VKAAMFGPLLGSFGVLSGLAPLFIIPTASALAAAQIYYQSAEYKIAGPERREEARRQLKSTLGWCFLTVLVVPLLLVLAFFVLGFFALTLLVPAVPLMIVLVFVMIYVLAITPWLGWQ